MRDGGLLFDAWFSENGKKTEETLFDKYLPYLSKIYYESGAVKKEIPKRNYKREGLLKEYYETGKLKRTEEYADGSLNGWVREYAQSGELQRETLFVQGQRNGPARTYYKNGKLASELMYRNDVLDGSVKNFYPGGRLAVEMSYLENNPNGIKKTYYEDGQIWSESVYQQGVLKEHKEFEYKRHDDKKEKSASVAHESDEAALESFRKIKDTRELYQDGRLKKENIYLNETDYIERSYHGNGFLQTEIMYQNGKPNGSGRNYHYQNGMLAGKWTYKDGNMDCCDYEYYPSGQLHIFSQYEEGRLTWRQTYSPSGELQKDEQFPKDDLKETVPTPVQ